MTTPRNYWMVAVSPEYYETTRDRNFDLLGLGEPQKKRAQRMELGDRVLYYVNGWRVFAAIAIVDSTYLEDHTPIWPSAEAGEDYAFRVRLRPSIVLKQKEYLDTRLIAPRMQYVRKWAPEFWPLAFQGLLHLIPKQDFMMLEDEMHKRQLTPNTGIEPNPDEHCALDALPLTG